MEEISKNFIENFIDEDLARAADLPECRCTHVFLPNRTVICT